MAASLLLLFMALMLPGVVAERGFIKFWPVGMPPIDADTWGVPSCFFSYGLLKASLSGRKLDCGLLPAIILDLG